MATIIVHGGKFGTKHKSKCGLWRKTIRERGERCLNYVDGITDVTCKACLIHHNPGKC